MKTKLKIIIPIIISISVIIAAFLLIKFEPNQNAEDVSPLSTAQKYLTELNYEQAIIEFKKAIELDPMNADAYLGLAQAYEKLGDIENAVATLEKGYELMGDERIDAALKQLLLTRDSVTDITETAVSETNEAISSETTAAREYTVEELEKALITLIESPNAEIEQSLLDNIISVDIAGKDYIAVNQSVRDKYSGVGTYIAYNGTVPDDTVFMVSYTNGNKDEYKEYGEITSCDFLKRCKNLNSICIRFNKINDISALANMQEIWQINLTGNQISDISAIEGMQKLSYLDVSYNKITDMSSLFNCTGLCGLYINNNQITDISPLSGCSSLTQLYIQSNQISNIEPLTIMTQISEINISYNNISEDDKEALKNALPNARINAN